jgi:hypothetical protein
MKARADSCTIVIPGYWNRMIFVPQWVMHELFHKQEVEKLVPLLPVAPLVYRDDELVLQVVEHQIIVQARKFDDNFLERVEKMACETLEALPKTPVSAIGVNFGFVESNPNDDILKLFNFSDNVEIASLDWNIVTKKITRQLTKDGMTLNLTITHDSPSNIKIDANFHYAVGSADDALERIKGHAVEMYQILITLLKNVYSLHKEEEPNE